ncbi:MAG TPA: hypothetical protein PLZ79_09470 [Burkholderiales bacterium]|nr:hypothetical protein [Burkholderiales bacterium]
MFARLAVLPALPAAWLYGVAAVHAAELTISAERLEGPGFTVRSARMRLDAREPGRLELRLHSLAALGREWREVSLTCDLVATRGARIGCESGALEVGQRIPLRAAYDTANGEVDVELTPPAGGHWRLAGAPRAAGWHGRLTIERGALAAVAPFLPPTAPSANAGQVSGSIAVAPSAGGLGIEGALAFSGVGFSDAAGRAAGEALAGEVKLAAQIRDDGMRYRGTLDWQEGALYVQPLYLKGGQKLSVEGAVDARQITVEAGRLRAGGVGEVTFSATWDRERGALASSAGGAAALDIRGVYEVFARPALAATAAADLTTDGTADFGWRFGDGALQAFYLNLHGAHFQDRQGRFGLSDLDANMPWERTAPTQARVTLGKGQVLQLPVGRVEVPMELDGFVARVAQVEIPVLDGKLRMNDFVARREDDAWEWTFAGGLTPVSVEALTRALGTHVMLGTLSAEVPKVRYRSSTVAVEGALLFQVFDGTVVVDRLSLADPFGSVPRLFADVDMRNLDLDLVTRTFAFGSITGRIDATVTGLELAAWQPVAFDAHVDSSPGSYPKRISQRAVENITALGGGSAAAAMQRTALKLFDTFGYRRIGWRCRLANGVCQMSGIAAKDGGYVIVEGGGIPAISVLGYNRAVDWQELITRLARVTREDSAPTIQ